MARARVVHDQESPDPFEGWREEVTRKMTSNDLAEAIYGILCIPMLVHPAYRGHDWIRLNPALAKVHTNKYTAPSGQYSLEVTISLPSSDADLEAKALDEYISDPPCRAVAVSVLVWDQETNSWFVPATSTNTCWAYNDTGLRLKDVLAVQDQVSATSTVAVESVSQRQQVMIAASLIVLGPDPAAESPTDVRMSSSYFEGPLPRYRKASDGLDAADMADCVKDQELAWSPKDDIDTSVAE